MIQLVIGLNVAIALLGFGLAWRIWRLKRTLTSASVVITAWERHVHRLLDPQIAPALILQGQRATASTRQRYFQLQRQLQQLQRIFSIALMILRFWPRGPRRSQKRP
ncbi:MAG: hypothetical protein ACFB0G_22020 [Leptolyngbyaceae cyanobacterium]